MFRQRVHRLTVYTLFEDTSVKGTITTSPTAVSPDDVNVSTADRTVTITVTDSDLNVPLFVGTGPNSEAPDISTADGEVLRVIAGQGLGNFILVLTSGNGIEPLGETPIADRNGDGVVNASDIVIVTGDLDGNGSNDITVFQIFDAAKGQVEFKNTLDNTAGPARDFYVRYATSARELTRANKSFTESLTIPATGLITGEAVTHLFSPVSLRGTGDFSASVNSVDVTVVSPATIIITTGDLTSSTAISLSATTNVGTGTSITLEFAGHDTLTLSGDVANGANFTLSLSNTIVDTGDGGGITLADISVVSGSATIGAVSGVTNTADLTATAALTTGGTITLEYTGREVFAVSSAGLVAGETFNLVLNIDNLPLQDSADTGTDVSTGDITVTVGTLAAADTPLVTSLGGTAGLSNQATGLATGDTISLVHQSPPIAAGTTITVTYIGLADLVSISGGSGAAFPVRLRETAADSGVYEATVVAVDGQAGASVDNDQNNLNPTIATGDLRPRLAVISGGPLTVTFNDPAPVRIVEATVFVEDVVPTFSTLSPASGDSTNVLTTVLSGNVTDTAGVDSTTVMFIVTADGVAQTVDAADVTVTESTAGIFTASYGVDNLTNVASAISGGTTIVTNIEWRIDANDLAGNLGSSETRPLTLDNELLALLDSFSGDNWDATNNRVVGARTTGQLAPLPGSDIRTVIRVRFDDTLNGASVQASDFLVDGVTPLSAQHFAGEAGDSVFLTLATALAPNARPKVDVVGEITDASGNAILLTPVPTIAQTVDGIAPVLDAQVVDNFTDGAIRLTALSDEPIAASLPVLRIGLCGPDLATGDTQICTIPVVTTPTSTIIVNRLQWTFDLAGLNDGRYKVEMDISDTNLNAGTAGNSGDTATDSLTFEIDSAIPSTIGTDPTNSIVVTTPPVLTPDKYFITFDWTVEGGEYTGDSHSAVTLTSVILSSVNPGVVPVVSSTRDNRTFIIAVSDLKAGDYTLTFAGTDEGGHASGTLTHNFSVAAQPTFDVDLSPGLNLVSFPNDPAKKGINDVISTADPIDFVFTYDPKHPLGPWLVAIRDPDTGLLVGTLTEIDSRHAYWMRTSEFPTLKVTLSPLGAQQLPANLEVMVNAWNLLPVLSVKPADQLVTPGQRAILALNYLGPASVWTTSLNFVTETNVWAKIIATIAGTSTVSVGKGYWVWYTAPYTLTQ